MTSQKPWFDELSLERAYEEIAKLSNAEVLNTDGVTIHKGIHPEHGDIRIVIAPFGEPVMLYLPI